MSKHILKTTVSCFKDYNTPCAPRPVNLLDWLTSEKYAAKVAQIRATEDKSIRDALKATLPAITPHGTFSYRSASHLLQHSGLLQFDIDFKENQQITNFSDLKKELCKIVNIAYCGLSVSGAGYWGLIPIAYPDKHIQYFDHLYFCFKHWGITLDRTPRSVASLRGYSYDPEAYFNHEARPLEQYAKPSPQVATHYPCNDAPTRDSVEALINEINKTAVDICPTYDDWLKLGFALAAAYGEPGRQFYHAISQYYTTYNHRETEEQYDRCLRSSGSGITISTFFYLCKEAGIVLPKAGSYTQKSARYDAPSKRDAHSGLWVAGCVSTGATPDGTPKSGNPFLAIHSGDFVAYHGSTFTGSRYNHIAIANFKRKNGGYFKILFDKDEELISPHTMQENVRKLSLDYTIPFTPAQLDNRPCWAWLEPQTFF